MSNFEETFKALLLEFLKRNGVEAVEVTSWNDECSVYNVGGCPSCAYDEKDYSVEIFYTPDDVFQYGGVYTYNGNFSDLLHELIAIGEELDARESE